MKKRTRAQRLYDDLKEWPKQDFNELVEMCLNLRLDRSEEVKREANMVVTKESSIELEKWAKMEGQLQGVTTGYWTLDRMTAGLCGGDLDVIAAPSSYGKGEPLDNLLPTPNGFRRMGDIKIGDYVFGNNGRPVIVKGVYDKGIKQTYEVCFSDGCKVEVCEDHLWAVQTPAKSGHKRYLKEQVLDTKTLYSIAHGDRNNNKNFFCGRKNNIFKCFLPSQEAVEYEKKLLPIHPYVLGALLADGHLDGTTLQWTKKDERIIEKVDNIEKLRPRKNSIQHGFKNAIMLKNNLEKLGLWGKRSSEKFIPVLYLLGSIEQRKQLLEGLLDGDGGLSGRMFVYSTTSEKLKDGVVELASSLGITVKVSFIKDSMRGKVDYWRVRLHLKDCLYSERKRKLQYRLTHREMVAVAPKRKTEIRCISVDASNELYLTSRNYIVTHNTLLAVNMMARQMALGHKVAFVTLEMSKRSILQRLYKIMTKDYFDGVMEPEPLLMQEQDRIPYESIKYAVKQAKEWGADVFYVDHLHYFSRSMQNQAEGLGAITQEFKLVAKEYDIPIVLISQMRKTEGRRPTGDDLRGSALIKQDADIVLILDRNEEIIKQDGTTDNVRVTLDKNRDRLIWKIGSEATLWKYGLDLREDRYNPNMDANNDVTGQARGDDDMRVDFTE